MAIKVSDLAKTATRQSFVNQAIRRDLNKQGLSQHSTVSDARAKKLAEEWKEEGLAKTYRSAGQVVRETQKSLAERNKQEDAPKMTMADLRKQREAMAKKMAGLYVREREATSAAKPANATTAALKTTAKTSALTPKKVTGPRATTSALRSTGGNSAGKPAAEEKPQAIDLAID